MINHNFGKSSVLQYQDSCFQWFMTTQHIAWHTHAFIFHARAYYMTCTKHAHCTPKFIVVEEIKLQVYNTQTSTDICDLCLIFHVIHPIGKAKAHNAQAVSTASYFCYRHEHNLSYQALHAEVHTWSPHWCATS